MIFGGQCGSTARAMHVALAKRSLGKREALGLRQIRPQIFFSFLRLNLESKVDIYVKFMV